jgi:hypothetical protein
MAPLAKEYGFVRKGRVFRREDEARTVAYLAIRSAPVTHRALTAFRVFGSVSPVEWTAWRRGGGGDPALLRSPHDGLEMWPLEPPFEFWDWEVTGRFWGNYPHGRPTPEESRKEGTWTFVTSEESLTAYGNEVARQLREQQYVANLVNLMDRDYLRQVFAEENGWSFFWPTGAPHYMLEASANPDRVDELLASAVPPLPARMEAFIRTTLPTLTP